MDQQLISQRADAALSHFDAWINDQLLSDPTADPRTLVSICFKSLCADSEFVRGWVLGTMMERVNVRLSQERGIFDGPDLVVKNGAAPKIVQTRAKPVPVAAGWSTFLEKKKVPLRMKLMQRDDLVYIAATERQQANLHERCAGVAETLLTRMPADMPQLKVGDVWSDAELKAISEAYRPLADVVIPALNGGD